MGSEQYSGSHSLDFADLAVNLLQLSAELVSRLLGLLPAAFDLNHFTLEVSDGRGGAEDEFRSGSSHASREAHSISAVRSSVNSPGLSHLSTKFIVCVPWL